MPHRVLDAIFISATTLSNFPSLSSSHMYLIYVPHPAVTCFRGSIAMPTLTCDGQRRKSSHVMAHFALFRNIRNTAGMPTSYVWASVVFLCCWLVAYSPFCFARKLHIPLPPPSINLIDDQMGLLCMELQSGV